MATYNLKFNKDDSVIRHVIVGLLADLNGKLSFFRQISNDERAEIDVPFFYAVSGDENFMKDSFLFSNVNGDTCDPNGDFADGNYDKVPRGIVNLSSFAVDPSKLVNKRNMGHYMMMNEDGLMEGYVAEFEMIPVVIGVDVEILVSSQLDLFKVTEAIVKKMYKANFYHVDAGHLEEGTYRITSEYAMPDDYTQERPVEYSFDDKQNHKVSFSLEINSFIPSFDFEEDVYRKFTRTSYANGIVGDYVDPNGFLDPTIHPQVYYDTYEPAKWESNGEQWIKTEVGTDATDTAIVTALGKQLTTESQIKRLTRRRKQSNRMFAIGNSNLTTPGQGAPNSALLGDNYKVVGKETPFGDEIDY
mgnify:FL=1|jgi:hypothetical protein|tara:strand:- start:3748 stop:4824 length:1077 start_codon:yes stop_codon:yes gene_type:complete